MKTIMSDYKIKSRFIHIKYITKYAIGAFCVFTLAFIILKFPGYSADGVTKGIDIALNTLIPSLYPFMIITNIITHYSYVFDRIAFCKLISNKLFGQPPSSLFVVIFSMIGGLPVGIKMTSDLYRKGVLTENESKRLSLFCMNAGPAFIINAVGLNMLGSRDCGNIIFISLILSSLTIGLLSKFLADNEMLEAAYSLKEKDTGKLSVSEAVTNASKNMLIISSWVVAFSCFNNIIEMLVTSEEISVFISSISEITVGCNLSADIYPIPVIAGIIGFGGICGHLQVWGFLSSFKMKYKYFLVSRILNGSLAIMYCNFLIRLFPPTVKTFSVGVKPIENGISVNEFIAVLMVIMAILSIVGDDYTLQKRRKKNIEK